MAQKREAVDTLFDFLSGSYEDKYELPTVDEFLSNLTSRNTWTYQYQVKVYVRKAFRLAPTTNKRVYCFDVATIDSDVPGIGQFTKWLAKVKEKLKDYDFDYIYVENVFTERFCDFFRKNGWIDDPRNPNCFFFSIKGDNMSDTTTEVLLAPLANDPMGLAPRELSIEEKTKIHMIKIAYDNLYSALGNIDVIGGSNEINLAKTKLQESCMWAVRHLTK
jgi:hypothetical protein